MNLHCSNFQCPEYNQGQCFGGGCARNPVREDDINADWFGEEDEVESEGGDNE